MTDVLHDLVLHRRQNQVWQFSGIDCREHCVDLKHFLNYPHPIEYRYNNRGFRDSDWPTSIDELKQAVWCVGDSFTVGIGIPLNHTWPFILAQRLGKRTINISLDGASNDWIARRITDIKREIDPGWFVVQWTFVERRENPDTSLSDEDRRNQSIQYTELENIANLQLCVESVDAANVIHSTIPHFSGYQASQKLALKTFVKKGHAIPYFDTEDYGRDGLHYDLRTANKFVDQIINFLPGK